MNKEEAKSCLDISKNKYNNGDYEGAVRLVEKSIRLYETAEAKEWVYSLNIAFIYKVQQALQKAKKSHSFF